MPLSHCLSPTGGTGEKNVTDRRFTYAKAISSRAHMAGGVQGVEVKLSKEDRTNDQGRMPSNTGLRCTAFLMLVDRFHITGTSRSLNPRPAMWSPRSRPSGPHWSV
jgi:hypothetical protein